jgi:hypothetical protein
MTLNHKIWNAFEQQIEEKYGVVAESMLFYLQDFQQFFEEEELSIADLKEEHIPEILNDYLDYDDLTQAEASMVFQTLVDFCDFCIAKDIDYSFFKKLLLNNKEDILDEWEEEFQLERNNALDESFEDITTQEMLSQFEMVYPFIKKNMKQDIGKSIAFCEEMVKEMKTTFDISRNLRKEFPELSQKEHDKKLKERTTEVLGPEKPFTPKRMESMFAVPEEKAKKFFTLLIKFHEVEKFERRDPKGAEKVQENIKELENFVLELKEMKQ